MNRFINNRQRRRLGFALGSVFLVIVLANWWVGLSMMQVKGQFTSVYQDRLVPALDIAAMQERYYQNYMLLEDHLQTTSPVELLALEQDLQAHVHEIDSLASKYEATYLTNQEKESLLQYKEAVQHLTALQLQTIELSHEGNKEAAVQLFRSEVVPAFTALLQPMHAMSQLQQDVGQELFVSAKQQMSTLKMLSTMIIALAVILAVITAVLLQNNHFSVKIKPQQFHLN